MSTRTHLYMVRSLLPLKKVIASRDATLVRSINRWAKSMGLEPAGFAPSIATMIDVDEPPKQEPGYWVALIRLLGENLDVGWAKLPLDDWKHYKIWFPYDLVVGDSITKIARKWLSYLHKGRPLAGKRVIDDGCVYGWLSREETRKLERTLLKLDDDVFPDPDMLTFHKELLQSLHHAVESNSSIIILAS